MLKVDRLEIEKFQSHKDWLSERQKAWDEMSKQYNILCICGRLCTGMHELQCRKFQDVVNLRTAKRLKKGEDKDGN